MALYFPDLHTLQLALTGGAVPPALAQAGVTAGFDDDGHVWVEPSVSVPRSAQAELKKLGVQAVKKMDAPSAVELSCWAQIIPLQQDPAPAAPSPTTPVLFELPAGKELPALVGEILRLGNDRQSYRHPQGDDERGPALLRVVGPPYYSLLRALDRDGRAAAPRAYLERAPRVWVEVGHTHPLAVQLKAPEGRIVLLRPPRDWVYLDDVPFRDIYDILEFSLPAAEVRWRGEAKVAKMTVPLRLAGGGPAEAPVMWVLRDADVAALDELVRTSDDHLLQRLDFAVAASGKGRVVALRVRPPIRSAPPVLVLPGEALRPYLKLPNLYLPVGRQLHPPLRRDAVRKLFADDPDVVTWLHAHDDGTFTPESLPDSVFRPLPDWVDYVLDHDRAALQAWMGSTQFEFDEWICKDEPERPDRPKKDRPERDPRGRKEPGKPAPPSGGGARPKQNKAESAEAEPSALPELPKAPPSELKKELEALEKEFLAIEGGLDAPARQALWPRLGLLNAAVGKHGDAALCWAHTLWEESPESARWARGWFAALAPKPPHAPFSLDKLLKKKDLPSHADLRLAAAWLVSGAHQTPTPRELLDRLRPAQEFLQKHEALLPVRIVWIVALALYRLGLGDLLALTRTRDRLLERLFKAGLTAEHDLPSFLRFSGVRASDRFRAFRDWLMTLPEKMRRWIGSQPPPSVLATPNAALTEGYASLLLAFGMARLGEERVANDLQRAARRALDSDDQVAQVLVEAYAYRIAQALDGKPPMGPLPDALMARVAKWDRQDRYVLDRMRERSRVLEPHQKIDPYLQFKIRFFDDVGKKLAALEDATDRDAIQKGIVGLLSQTRGKSKDDRAARAQVVKAGLGLAPRVGEEFALLLLAEAPAAYQSIEDPLHAAEFLEKALFTAAHFDQAAQVQQMVKLFRELIEKLRGGPGALGHLDSLAAQCFRGLRKLGLREEIHELLGRTAAVVTEGKPYADLRGSREWHNQLRALLRVAAGWYYFGMEDEARPVVEEARLLLYQGSLIAVDRTKLAAAYVATLGQAPVDLAMQCIDELFAKLSGVNDMFATSRYCSQSQLTVIEGVVLAVVTEDFALGTAARRWLDDEEFVIRRRVHDDVHTLMGQAHL